MSDESNVMVKQHGASLRVTELREAFDLSFAEPVIAAEAAGELGLAVRAGSGKHVIRLSDIAGIHETRTIVPLPGMKPACLGIVGLRGRLHAVFRLSALLGGATEQTNPKWLLMTPGRDTPAFAVDSIDGCVAMKPDEIRPMEHSTELNRHLRALFVRNGEVRELLHIPALMALALGKPHQPSDESS